MSEAVAKSLAKLLSARGIPYELRKVDHSYRLFYQFPGCGWSGSYDQAGADRLRADIKRYDDAKKGLTKNA